VDGHGVPASDVSFVDRGSVQLAEWIRERQPAACVCGHVHHRETVTEMLGATTVINAGPHRWVLRL
jgi:Icc-related predicted phosphoesterase